MKVFICKTVAILFIIAIALPIYSKAAPSDELAHKGSITIYFGPASKMGTVPQDGLYNDGSVYTSERGFGWDQDLTLHTRDREDGCMGVAILDRNVREATFTIDLPDGDYLFDAKAFDSRFPGGIAIKIDGEYVAKPMSFDAGKPVTMTAPVESRGGRAEITIVGGKEGVGNCLLSSLHITSASSDLERWSYVKDAVYAYHKNVREAREARLARRIKLRNAYQGITIRDQHLPRQTIDLCGNWLFQPTGEVGPATAVDPSANDTDWHTMHVPDFWKPIEWWIYTSTTNTSHNFLLDEIRRCQELTFDYTTTNSGWYRQWIDVPESMRGRRLVLRFDAAASVTQVYWNGKQVGSHIGMFGPFECDVTSEARFGEKNLLAVMVSSGRVDPAQVNNENMVVVTVDVTSEMLNSLARGCYVSGMAGIWQPVTLIVSGKDRISDVYFRPRMDGARIETTISTSTVKRDKQPASGLLIRNTIVDAATGKILYNDADGIKVVDGNAVADTGKLRPKLWSPEHPNLYILKTRLVSGGSVVDEVSTTVGFKTFEVRGNRLYLNDKPYFIRGADMPPHGIRPNDKALADKFMKMMHDGNTMATRFHVGPPSKIWLDAADKYGVGSSVGENWPWVLIGDTPIPDGKLIELWQKDFIEVVRANRNHPSLMIWTISNESYFEHDTDVARRIDKYRIFSDLIKEVRKESPDIPIVFHSGHVHSKDQQAMLESNNIDEGDIDDLHAYYAWYGPSPFHSDAAKDIESFGTGTRPLISQEASTGYPDNDTGHPTECYIRSYAVPQAWVGKYALYSARPDMFLDTHGQLTKEFAEKIRRQRTWLSGLMLFANCCWFKNVYDADTIAPYPVYWGVKMAWQPVLVSLESPNRHFTAGQKFASDVVVVNDDPDKPNLTDLTLVWRVRAQSNNETSGSVKIPDCMYDGKSRTSVEFEMPVELPVDCINAVLKLELRSGETVVSRNEYPLICVPDDWRHVNTTTPITVVESGNETSTYLRDIGFDCRSVDSVDWATLAADTTLVIAPDASIGPKQEFADFVRNGGRALMIAPRGEDSALAMIPDFEIEQVKTVDTPGDFADIIADELLDGMDPMNIRWWNAGPNDLVRVCQFGYQLADIDGVTKLARHIQSHFYIKPNELPGLTSFPAFEVERGNGRVIVSSFLLANDPVAQRFLINTIKYLVR